MKSEIAEDGLPIGGNVAKGDRGTWQIIKAQLNTRKTSEVRGSSNRRTPYWGRFCGSTQKPGALLSRWVGVV